MFVQNAVIRKPHEKKFEINRSIEIEDRNETTCLVPAIWFNYYFDILFSYYYINLIVI